MAEAAAEGVFVREYYSMHNSSDTVQGCHGSFQSRSRVCIFPTS